MSEEREFTADELLRRSGALVYDLEIVCAVPMEGEPRKPGLHYCGGWTDYAGMGISVCTAYSFKEGRALIYMADNLQEMQKDINNHDVIIGFNNDRFDNNVLLANGVEVPKAKSYDLWKRIVATVQDTGRKGARSGFSLKYMLEANGLPGKSGYGGDAPEQAQSGKWGELIQYCLDDTMLTAGLVRLAATDQMLAPKDKGGHLIKVKKPWEFCKVEMDGLF